jgi:hypothetical protein
MLRKIKSAPQDAHRSIRGMQINQSVAYNKLFWVIPEAQDSATKHVPHGREMRNVNPCH